MKHLFLNILTILFFVITINAQVQNNMNSAELLQAMQKLQTLGSVLYIAAHPDDENTRLLSYMANELKLKTTYLSLTRGDGGQNLIGKEQGISLGLIRTQELLAARRTDGAEQMFTRAYDFGYSKNPEETFTFWNHDSILADVVLAIRKVQPDVIICRFPTNGDGGHGHHTASGILGEEAFIAAADPKKFPEQLAQYPIWKTKRIFFNAWPPEGKEISTDLLKVDVGVYNPLLGKSYGEIAAESRSNHKSQGFGSARIRGTRIEYLRYLQGDSAKISMLENVNIQWSRIAGGEKIDTSIQEVIKNFNALRPQNSVERLVKLYKQIQSIPNGLNDFWKKIKLAETQQLIYNCAGIFMETVSDDYIATAGKENIYTTQILSRYDLPIKLQKISFLNTDTNCDATLKENELFTFKRKTIMPNTYAISNPYWLQNPVQEGLFHLSDNNLIGQGENISSTQTKFDIEIYGTSFSFLRPLTYKSTDPVRGEVYRPFEVLPKVTVNFNDKIYLFPNVATGNKAGKNIVVDVLANKDNCVGELLFDVSGDYELRYDAKVNIPKKGEVQHIAVTIIPKVNAAFTNLTAKVILDGNSFSKSIQRIDYEHIPAQFYLTPASAKLIPLNIKSIRKNIGYIPGAGDDVAACLAQAGYQVTILTNELLGSENLNKFDAIITGVRAYNTNNQLSQYYTKLMAYINQGGNMIVQYNTNNFVSKVQEKIGPYPFSIGRDRVTDEKAVVQFLSSNKTTLLNFPNEMVTSDFDNWIQERCIYSVKEKDSAYQTVLAWNDPNEKANENSLIIAKYGKGNFIYTGIVFFRELPAGIPGAYRLMANMIDAPKNK
jgi:LmbE family N-acetylglucosaminyl deacetylase